MPIKPKKANSLFFISQIKQVLWITLSWTLISMFQFLIGFGVIVELGYDFIIDPLLILRTSAVTGFIGGILGGSVLVFFWEEWLRAKPYGWTIRNILITYTILFFIVSIPPRLFFQSQMLHLPHTDPEVWRGFLRTLIDPSTLIPYSFWLIVVLGTLVVFLVNDKYGPGVFRKFLMGRYFNPTREERVFMFLDLRSSTSIAEKLGEEKYFNFIRDVYKEITPGILQFKGEIYQYVGDEVVVSWPTDSGVNDANCINSFFAIQGLLAQKESYFISKYDTMPEFKAGLHYGHVMAGEVGIVKRDIAFSGDVLNTTSRIQEQCNQHGVNILLSKHLLDKLVGDHLHLSPREIGDIDLRGKQEKVALYTV